MGGSPVGTTESPDTTTAGTCIEHLSVILMQVAQRHVPSPLHYEQDKLRVIAKRHCFAELITLSFNQILENAEGNTEILVRLITAIAQISSVTTLPKRRLALRQWLETIEEVAPRKAKSGYAITQIQKHIDTTRLALKQSAVSA